MITSDKLPLSDSEYERIKTLAYEHTGIVFGDFKQDFVRSRITRRMRELGLKTVGEYCDYIERNREPIEVFTSQITTNHTHFFREAHHFQTLVEHVNKIGISRCTIWCAASSTGEEPYSILMALLEAFPNALDSGLKVIASDLDVEVLRKAQLGIYKEKRIESLSRQQASAFFIRGTGSNTGCVRVKKPLRDFIDYKKINLKEPFPIDQRINILFCRNVVIYFDSPTKQDLFKRFSKLQQPDDILLLGHSESMNGLSEEYVCTGNTTYVRL
ncbi:MAG: chemotaxis protein CheR [Granulosicoccus sp.]|nr:chemotaxis protein CheR [Granulosicoccus sp.]